MGKPPKAQSYRDDPDAVSMHTTPEDYEYPAGSSTSDELPSYADSENVTVTERANDARASRVAGYQDNYSTVNVPASGGWRTSKLGKKGSSREVSARMDPRLSDPNELYRYVDEYLQHMGPTPRVWIEGWHWQTVRRNDKKEKERVTDFDISMDLTRYLGVGDDVDWRKPRVATNGENVHRGSWRRSRAPGVQQDLEVGGPEERGLRAWVEDFCNNASRLKIFRVSRTVTGLDEACLKTNIENMIRRTNYLGHVEVAVVIEDRAVDIYSNHWINTWRTGWQRWIFYLTFLWIFTWPLLFFMTKRWAVFTIDWPFSVAWPERGHGARRFATISEEAWLKRHEQLVRRLVIERFSGEATNMPLDVPESRPRERMPSSGNANVDSAVSFIQGGVNAWNSLQRGVSGDAGGWGRDC